jgi:hypothetical protein
MPHKVLVLIFLVLSAVVGCIISLFPLASIGRSSTWATEISTVNGLAAPPCEIHPNVGSTFVNVIKPHPNSPATGPTTPIRGIQHLPQIFLPPPPSSVINAAVQVVASPCCSPGRSVGTVEHDERIWGEILERSLSSNSLHHLHRLHRNHDDEDDDDGNRSSRVVDSARTPAAASYQQEKRRNGKPPGNWHVWRGTRQRALWIFRRKDLGGQKEMIGTESRKSIRHWSFFFFFLFFFPPNPIPLYLRRNKALILFIFGWWTRRLIVALEQ